MNDKNDFIYKENELLKRIRELDNKFTDKINKLNSSMDKNKNSFKDTTEKISVNIKSMLESIVSNKIKLEKLTELEKFKKKTEDTLITHEIRINNTLDEMNYIQFKYNKVLSENFSLPGIIGQSCQFKNLSEYISFNINEVSKLKAEKDFIKKTCNELRIKVNDTIKTLLTLSDSIVMRCNIYTDKRKEELKRLLEEKLEPINEKIKNGDFKNSKKDNITIVVEKESTKNIKKEKENMIHSNKNMNILKEELLKIIDNKFMKYSQNNDFETKLLQNIENCQFIHQNIGKQIDEINEEIKDIKINILQNNTNKTSYIQNNTIPQQSRKNNVERNSLRSTPSPRVILTNNDNSKKYFPTYGQQNKSRNSTGNIKQEKIEIDTKIKVKNLNSCNKEKNDKYRVNLITKNNLDEQNFKNIKTINNENLEKAIEVIDSSKNFDQNFIKSEKQKIYAKNIINEEKPGEKNNTGMNINNSKDYPNKIQTKTKVKELIKKNLFSLKEDSKCDNNFDSLLENCKQNDDLIQKNVQKSTLQNLINPKLLQRKILSDEELKTRNKTTKKKAISDIYSIKYDLKLNIDKNNDNNQSGQNKLNDCLSPKIPKLHKDQSLKCHIISLKLKKLTNFYEENGACVIANKKLTNQHIIKNNDLPNSFESLFNVHMSSKKNDKINYFGKTSLNFYKSELMKPNITNRNIKTGIKKFITEAGFK